MMRIASAWAGIGASCLGVALLCGCQHTRDSINNDQDIRKGAVDKARSSCVQTASAKLGHSPTLDAKVNQYCDCFATQGMAKFSNTELIDIGLTGADKLNDAQKAKLNAAVDMCVGQLQTGPAPAPAVPPSPAPSR